MIVLDIETQNTFQDVGGYNPSLLKVSLVGIYDSASDSFRSFREGELKDLWPILERTDRVIGYNIKGFDFPVLNSYYPGDLLRLPTVDLMYLLEEKIGFRVSLDSVASATLGTQKSGSGLKAVAYYAAGEWDKLIAYCLDDVKLTRDLYEYAVAHKELKYRDRQWQTVAVPIEILSTAPAKSAGLNLTMGF